MSAALIYSHALSPRLQYVVEFLSQYYGIPFRLTSSEEVYNQSAVVCKINYSYHRLHQEELWIHPHALLFESAVHPIKLECFEKAPLTTAGKAYPVFFKAEGDVGFDLLAGIFFLITRYEEYLPHQKDRFGRYAHQNSTAFKNRFLQLPLVNIWLEDLRGLLAQKEPAFAKPARTFSFLPTYDIDMAWSYLNKGFQRNAAAAAKLFFTGRWRSLAHRLAVLRGKRSDPFDAYQWMDELHARFGLRPLYFFLLAKKNGRFDKNIPPQHPQFQTLVKRLANRYEVGVHPSWQSGEQPALIAAERALLQQLSGQTVGFSRQHFIRFNLPETYRRLMAAGIEQEFSMGYGSINGFRASVATAYHWYDLKNEAATRLLVRPFCFMEATSYYDQQQTPEAALEELRYYRDAVAAVNGELITIWHNSFLGTDQAFAGWREVYQRFIEEVCAKTTTA